MTRRGDRAMSLVDGLAGRFHRWNRARKVEWLHRFVQQHQIRTVVLVGVGTSRADWENLVERSLVGWVDQVTWTGLDRDAAAPYVVADALALPFRDDAVDLVFSNAVIEHVGGCEAQRRFLAEHRRVGRSWVATTPNRWFPVESHTRVLLRHWSARWRRSRAEFTRLLSRRELADLTGGAIAGSPVAPTFIAWEPPSTSPGRR
jgi:hypothetical protein